MNRFRRKSPAEQREYDRNQKRARRARIREQEEAEAKRLTPKQAEQWLYDNNDDYRRSVDATRAKFAPHAERETVA